MNEAQGAAERLRNDRYKQPGKVYDFVQRDEDVKTLADEYLRLTAQPSNADKLAEAVEKKLAWNGEAKDVADWRDKVNDLEYAIKDALAAYRSQPSPTSNIPRPTAEEFEQQLLQWLIDNGEQSRTWKRIAAHARQLAYPETKGT